MTWLDGLTLETVIVHTRDGQSFKGIKSVVHDDCLVLRDALLLDQEDASVVLNGLIAVPREQVSFLQVVGG
jgi:hypothetical protein